MTRIELALQMTPGVIAARASSLTNAVDVDYQPERTSFDGIRASIEQAGYHVAEIKPPKDAAAGLDPEDAERDAEYVAATIG